MKLFDGTGCQGDARNVSQITAGCDWQNNFFQNASFPLNMTRNANNTYFEIRECGGAETPWIYMLMTVLLIASCAGCCGFCLCSYCYKKRGKRRKSIMKNNNNSPLVINQEYNEGHGSTAPVSQ